jgi:ATP-binding cassette, subfamily B, bacterial PglK
VVIPGKIKGLKSFRRILPRDTLRKLYLLVFVRLLANLLDLVGLAGVAILSLALSDALAPRRAAEASRFPLDVEFEFTENNAVSLALAVMLTFILKSVASITLRTRTAQFVASVEVQFATKIALDYFLEGQKKSSLSDFQNTAISSTEALSLYINSRIAIIVELALLALLVGMFLIINPIATFVSLAYFGLVFFILSKVVRLRIREKGERKMYGFRESLGSSRDLFGARREIRAAGVLDIWVEKFARSREKSARSGASVYALASIPRYILETALVVGIFLFLGGIVIFSDLRSEALTIGVFMAGGVRLSALLVPIQGSLNQMTDGASRGKFAYDRLCEIALQKASSEETYMTSRNQSPLSLEFRKVSFSFKAGKPILRDVSFTVLPGQKVAIVGPSGAGKTTSFELASGFLRPTEGQVFLGSTLAHEMLSRGHGAIGIVTQRPQLVTGTLAENISLVSYEKTDKSLVADCLKIAGLGHLSSSSDLGSPIEPDSGELSGGEIQRVGLARALYHRPGIVFLDEATSALDAQTESGVNSALENLRGETTILLIAHRLSTVTSADKIIYLDKGKILAEGTFTELQKLVPDFEESVRLMSI